MALNKNKYLIHTSGKVVDRIIVYLQTLGILDNNGIVTYKVDDYGIRIYYKYNNHSFVFKQNPRKGSVYMSKDGSIFYEDNKASAEYANNLIHHLIRQTKTQKAMKHYNLKKNVTSIGDVISNYECARDEASKNFSLATNLLFKLNAYSTYESEDYYTTKYYDIFYFSRYGLEIKSYAPHVDDIEEEKIPVYQKLTITFNGQVVLDYINRIYIPGDWEQILYEMYVKVTPLKKVIYQEERQEQEEAELKRAKAREKSLEENDVYYNGIQMINYKHEDLHRINELLKPYNIKITIQKEYYPCLEFTDPTYYYQVSVNGEVVYQCPKMSLKSIKHGEWESIVKQVINNYYNDKEAISLKRTNDALDFLKKL